MSSLGAYRLERKEIRCTQNIFTPWQRQAIEFKSNSVLPADLCTKKLYFSKTAWLGKIRKNYVSH
jgi:hypothetical protein